MIFANSFMNPDSRRLEKIFPRSNPIFIFVSQPSQSNHDDVVAQLLHGKLGSCSFIIVCLEAA